MENAIQWLKALSRGYHSFVTINVTSHAKTYTNGYLLERLKAVRIEIWVGILHKYNWFDNFVYRIVFSVAFYEIIFDIV